jgi:hypothetical protein
LQKIATETKQKLEDNNHYNSESIIMCELGIGIAEIMLVVSTLTDNQGDLHIFYLLFIYYLLFIFYFLIFYFLFVIGQAQMMRVLDPPLTRHFPIILSYPGTKMPLHLLS